MSNYFLLRGRSALLREVMAAWISLTAGALLFGVVFAKFSAAGEGTAFVAASVLAIPVSYLLLQGIRAGHLRLPELSIPKGVPTSDTETASHWQVGESRRFAGFWESLDADEKEGLQCLTGMFASSVLVDPSAAARPTFSLDESDIIDLKDEIKEGRRDEFIVKVKDRSDCFVVVKVDRKKREISYTLRSKEAL
jgi:hypothetical protein